MSGHKSFGVTKEERACGGGRVGGRSGDVTCLRPIAIQVTQRIYCFCLCLLLRINRCCSARLLQPAIIAQTIAATRSRLRRRPLTRSQLQSADSTSTAPRKRHCDAAVGLKIRTRRATSRCILSPSLKNAHLSLKLRLSGCNRAKTQHGAEQRQPEANSFARRSASMVQAVNGDVTFTTAAKAGPNGTGEGICFAPQ